MVFAGSEGQARLLADPLRTVLWGDHKISGESRTKTTGKLLSACTVSTPVGMLR